MLSHLVAYKILFCLLQLVVVVSEFLYHDMIKEVGYSNTTDKSFRYCPCCGYHHHEERFSSFNKRKDAMCPVCGSLERHRMTCTIFGTYPFLLQTSDGTPFRLLHFGPQKNMDKAIRRLPFVDQVQRSSAENNYTLYNILIHIHVHSYNYIQT